MKFILSPLVKVSAKALNGITGFDEITGGGLPRGRTQMENCASPMRRSRVGSEPAMERPVMFKFRIYVAGDALNFTQALSNLAALCRAHLPERHQLEVVDVFKEPKRALTGIFMTPTLIKLAPSPGRRIVGTLSRTQTVLQALGLERYVA